jgi:hypothetical protein
MRVRFTLNRFDLQSGRTIAAVREVFGRRGVKWANCNEDVIFECSAERFIRFQISQNEHGGENGFKSLKLEIINPENQKLMPLEVYD